MENQHFVYQPKRSTPTASSSSQKNPIIPFDYFVILDFEAVWNTDKDKQWPAEIIEFPSVLLNAKTLQIEGEFQRFLKPKVNIHLNSICIDTTGITQEMVDSGISLEQTLEEYHKWLQEKHLIPSDTASDEVQNVPRWSFVTCGDWDLMKMLVEQTKQEGLERRPYFRSWVNIKKVFHKFYKRNNEVGMAGMLQYLKLELSGRHHSGIDDCRNITKIVIKLLQDGCVIDQTTKGKLPQNNNNKSNTT